MIYLISSRYRKPKGRPSMKRKLASEKAKARYMIKNKSNIIFASNVSSCHHDVFNKADICKAETEEDDNHLIYFDSVSVESNEVLHAKEFNTNLTEDTSKNSQVTLSNSANAESHHGNRDHILRRSARIQNFRISMLKKPESNNCRTNKPLNKKSVGLKSKRNKKQNENVLQRIKYNSDSVLDDKSNTYNVMIGLLNSNSPLPSHNTTQVTHSRIPECVEGDFYTYGKKFIIIKWKDGGKDSIAEENLTLEMKKLLFIYYKAQLLNLQKNLHPGRHGEVHTSRPMENLDHNLSPDVSNYNNECEDSYQSIDKNKNIKLEKSSILEFKRQQKMCMSDANFFEKMGLADPELDLKLPV